MRSWLHSAPSLQALHFNQNHRRKDLVCCRSCRFDNFEKNTLNFNFENRRQDLVCFYSCRFYHFQFSFSLNFNLEFDGQPRQRFVNLTGIHSLAEHIYRLKAAEVQRVAPCEWRQKWQPKGQIDYLLSAEMPREMIHEELHLKRIGLTRSHSQSGHKRNVLAFSCLLDNPCQRLASDPESRPTIDNFIQPSHLRSHNQILALNSTEGDFSSPTFPYFVATASIASDTLTLGVRNW